jgi:hypothetical protein
MDNMWEKIKKSIRDGATVSMEKIEEYTKLGKLKVEEMAAKRKIERNFMDIGERAFDLMENQKGADIASDLSVKKSLENIYALREELAEIDRKVKDITEASKKTTKVEEESGISGI